MLGHPYLAIDVRRLLIEAPLLSVQTIEGLVSKYFDAIPLDGRPIVTKETIQICGIDRKRPGRVAGTNTHSRKGRKLLKLRLPVDQVLWLVFRPGTPRRCRRPTLAAATTRRCRPFCFQWSTTR